MLVLQLLNERDMYGYELVKEMDQRSDHHFQMKEGTLYPAIHKLEKQAYISFYWQEQEKSRARKYICITELKKNMLEEKTSEWHCYVQVMNSLTRRDQS
ncbi:putative DNA-binding protein YwzG [Virgibacillus kapii]|uniref:DNA-binding protein YwzG n=1 Tax=Virgibacillus kapii TaxID=1638645 RepID=A0ABQ2DR20_9BACI|nr:hypothetical protein M948_01440 [Virgibacillus sp. CM-4]GGJ68524.1 putative DNA-binding protein YwzG [Virgibacillus kapii]